MKRFIISALAVAALTLGASAAEFTHSFVVNLKSGATVEYQFADDPVMTFEGEDIKVTALKGETLLEPVADVQNITFTATPTGVSEVAADGSHIVVRYDGLTLSVAGLGAGSRLCVYSVDGVLRASAEADEAGLVSVPVQELPGGVYVAASKEHKFKFVKK